MVEAETALVPEGVWDVRPLACRHCSFHPSSRSEHSRSNSCRPSRGHPYSHERQVLLLRVCSILMAATLTDAKAGTASSAEVLS